MLASTKRIIVIIILVIAAAGIWFFWQKPKPAPLEEKPMAQFETINLTTADGVKLVADYYSAEAPQKFFVLVHMMPATKESWQEFAGLAQASGSAALAIDLRGHGQSEGGPAGYQQFSDAQHQASIKDVEAAVAYVLEQGAKPEQLILAGASIGANLVLQYLVEHPEIKKAELLSPGLNYRGINAEALVTKLHQGQALWLVAADDDNDGQNSVWVRQLHDLIDESQVAKFGVTFKSGGHGTNIFKVVPELMEKFVKF